MVNFAQNFGIQDKKDYIREGGDMSIKLKNLVAFTVVFLFFISMQLYQFYISEMQWKDLKKIEDQTLKAALLADELKLSVVQVQQWLTDISATRGKDGLDDGFANAEKYAKLFYEKLEEMNKTLPHETQMLQETKHSFDRYYEMGKKMANEYIEGGHEKGNLIMGEFDKTAEDINKRIDSIRSSKLAEITESVAKVEQANQSNIRFSFIYFIVFLLVGLTVVYVHSRTIIRPLNRLIQDTKRIAEGDLSQKISSASKDEIGQLGRSFEAMRMNLATLIEQIKTMSRQVAATSKELTAGVEQAVSAGRQIASLAEEMANGAEIQAKGADEGAKAMEEMAIGIQRIAEISGEMAELSVDTAKKANQGNESIQKAIAKMESLSDVVHQSASVIMELGERSKEINQIIEVITKIASQTHMLALNAAIEASRAGEQGKGFAVVANEIRKLADQSKSSAEMIAETIRKIQDDIGKAVHSIAAGTQETEEGKNIMRKAGEVFRRILEDSERVAAQIQEVSAATEQMSAGSEEITASIAELNEIAKESYKKSRDVDSFSKKQFASMEGISISAHALNQRVQELNASINRFKIEVISPCPE